MTLSKLLTRLGLAVLYMLRLDADECVSCGEVFRGRSIAWSPAPRCSSCARAASLAGPVGPSELDRHLALVHAVKALGPAEPDRPPAQHDLLADKLASPRPECRSTALKRAQLYGEMAARRAPSSPAADHARAAAERIVGEATDIEPEVEVELILEADAGALDDVVAVLYVTAGASRCRSVSPIGLDPWQTPPWVAAELELLRASVLSEYVFHTRGTKIAWARKVTRASYVLDLGQIFDFYAVVGRGKAHSSRFVSRRVPTPPAE